MVGKGGGEGEEKGGALEGSEDEMEGVGRAEGWC